MNFSLGVLAVLALGSYAAAALAVLRHFESRALALISGALVLHGAALMVAVQTGSGHFGLALVLSLLVWQTALILTLLWRAKALQPLRVSVYLFAGFGVLLAAVPSSSGASAPQNWKILLHAALSIFAAGLLSLAAAQAIAVVLISRMLHEPQRLAQALKLPSLQASEAWFFQLIAAGFFVLSLALISGLVFVDDLFAQHLAHKTVFSLLAWAIFAALLVGKRVWGWRGNRAARWALSGYGVLLLAYFGTKLVLEQILGRHW